MKSMQLIYPDTVDSFSLQLAMTEYLMRTIGCLEFIHGASQTPLYIFGMGKAIHGRICCDSKV